MADGSVTIEFNGDTKSLDKDIKGISGKVQSGLGKLGSIAGTAMKGVSVAVGAAATAIGGLVTASVNAYAEYEQLVGGVDTLFKNSSQKLQSYADEAYKTAGMSANEYMSTVTSFSASLLQSLGGDTEKAADYANQAVIDMSDNANKMGTSMELIQNAYQGFAKQNYTMLDNLKLGYGGTKEEMERLLEDASKISGIKYDISSFADVTQAIHVMQESMGIAGTTSKEASETIEGSINSVKGAWENLLVGITNPDADWDKLIQNLVDTVTAAGENILPAVGSALVGVSALIRDLFPMIAQEIPTLISEILPQLVDTGISVVNSLITGIQQNLPALMEGAIQIVTSIGNAIITMLPQILTIAMQLIQTLINGIIIMLPQIIQMGMQLITQLILGIAQMLPQLIPQAVNAIITIVNGLLDNIDMLVDAAIQLILGLADGLINALPILIEKAPEIIMKLVTALIKNAPKILEAGVQLIVKLVEGVGSVLGKLGQMAGTIIQTIWDGLKSLPSKMLEVGKNLIQGIWNGISNAVGWLWDKISGFCSGIVDKIKGFFGIHSPSKVFADEVGKFLALGLGEGFDDNLGKVYKNMQSAVDFETQKLSANLSTTATNNKLFTANILMKPSDIYLDSTKVGRAVTPAVTKTLRGAGAY
nr:MAG TPA: tail tape measure protein [Bacteriophage sp.]